MRIPELGGGLVHEATRYIKRFYDLVPGTLSVK